MFSVQTPPIKQLRILPAWTREIDEAIAEANAAEATRRAHVLGRLARLVSARRDYWWSVSSGMEAAATARSILLGLAIASTIVTVLSVASVVYLYLIGLCLTLVLGLVSTLLWIILLASHLSLRPIHERVRARGGRCPDCDYDLRGTPSVIDPSELGGVNVGPRTCQECGCAWPLLFPPMP